MKIEGIDKVIFDFCDSFIPAKSLETIAHKIELSQVNEEDLYIELIIGGILGLLELNIVYEYMVSGKTPDWTILDDKQKPIAIFECSQLNIDYETNEKTSVNDEDKPIIIPYWMDEELSQKGRTNCYRLYEKLANKQTV